MCLVVIELIGLLFTFAQCLNSWDPTCHTLGATLIRLEKRGYTIFRTKVTERSWNDNNVETKNGFAPVNKDPAWVEQFFQRFNLVLWRAQRGKVDWIKKAPLFGSEWQIFATLDDYQTHGYQTSFM